MAVVSYGRRCGADHSATAGTDDSIAWGRSSSIDSAVHGVGTFASDACLAGGTTDDCAGVVFAVTGDGVAYLIAAAGAVAAQVCSALSVTGIAHLTCRASDSCAAVACLADAADACFSGSACDVGARDSAGAFVASLSFGAGDRCARIGLACAVSTDLSVGAVLQDSAVVGDAATAAWIADQSCFAHDSGATVTAFSVDASFCFGIAADVGAGVADAESLSADVFAGASAGAGELS